MEQTLAERLKPLLIEAGKVAAAEFKKILDWQDQKEKEIPWFGHNEKWFEVERSIGGPTNVWFEGDQIIVEIKVFGWEWVGVQKIPAKAGFADDIIAKMQHQIDDKLKYLKDEALRKKQEKEAHDRAEYERLKAKFEGDEVAK